jgi:hypothetical protein
MTFLIFVSFFRNPVGALNQLPICKGIVVGELLHQPLQRHGVYGLHRKYFTTYRMPGRRTLPGG